MRSAADAEASWRNADCALAAPTPSDTSCRWPALVLLSGATFWLWVASVLALIASIKFHGPGFLADQAWLTYGRVRPAAWQALLYGGAMPLGLAAALWLSSHLCRMRLALSSLAAAGAVLWNVGVLAGVWGILAGASTGFEWLEMPRHAAVMLFLGYGLMGMCALGTVQARPAGVWHPSEWFLLAAVFWFPWVYSTAHLLLVVWPVRGVTQAVVAWWYATNLGVVWLGLVGLGLVFYFVPRLLERPLHSRALALVTFGGLVLLGGWTGVPTGAPVPAWMPALSTATGVLMLVPLLATLLNCWHTFSGRGWKTGSRPPLGFFVLGLLAYVVFSLIGVVDALPAVGRLTQFTWLTPARHQLAIYGFFVMTATGAIYEILPRLTGHRVGDRRVALHLGTAAVGLVLAVVPLAASGVVQGLKLNHPMVPFLESLNATLPMVRLSTLGEVLLLLANSIFLANVAGVVLRLGRAQLAAAWRFATAPVPRPEGMP